MGTWTPTIGLECHAQLATRHKLFCACPTDGVAACPICQGHPGVMPVLNEEAAVLALRGALALGCVLSPTSTFARKHYVYPDTPKGYQITQGAVPIGRSGELHVQVEGVDRCFAIARVHLEEDAGRIVVEGGAARLDDGRAGVPLIEIVGAPDLDSPAAAEAWLRMVAAVLVEAGVSEGAMERGNLRCDVNVSLSRPESPPGVRVELKNLNSPRFVARALRDEIERQRRILDTGGVVRPETRAWDGKQSRPLREKVDAAGYGIIPEPDLPPLEATPARLAAAAAGLPAGPLSRWILDAAAARVEAFRGRYGLSAVQAGPLLADEGLMACFVAAVEAGGAPEAMAAWVCNEVGRLQTLQPVGHLRPADLVALQAEVAGGRRTRAAARQLLAQLWERGGALAEMQPVAPLIDEVDRIRSLAQALIVTNVDQAARYRAGEAAMLGYFMGLLVRALGGRADPRLCNRIVREELEGS